jgi:hypothetical protein
MSAPAPARRPASRKLRIAIRIGIVFAALVLLVFVAAEIIFRTNLPRNLVIAAVEKQTGLHFNAKSLTTGLLGHTTLYGVDISLPLADKPFLQISEMSLDHTSPLLLLLGGDLTIYSADLDSPYLTLRQGADSTWNFQQVSQLLTPPNATTRPSGDVTLPTVEISNATVVISDAENRSATIEHAQFDGQPKGVLLWECKLQVPGHADITGKIATGRAWAHEVDFQLDDLKPWVSPWIASWPQSAKIQGQWTGRIDDGKFQGRLALSRAGYSGYSITGPVQIAATPDGAQLQPTGAIFHNANNPALDTQITSGNITIGSTGIQAHNLGLQFPRGFATVEASYQPINSTTKVQASWRDLAIPAKSTHSGQLALNFSIANGLPTFDASLESTGTFGSDTWDAALTARGSGDKPHNINTTITAQKFTITGSQGRSFDLSNFVADIGSTADGLELRGLQLENSTSLAGQGGYSYAKKVGWFSLDCRGIRLPKHPPYMIDLDLNIWSDPSRVHLSQLWVSSGSIAGYLNGEYVYKLPKPVQAHFTLTHTPQASETPDLELEPSDVPAASNLTSNVDITGTLGPIDLTFTGSARGSDLRFRQRMFGNLDVKLSGTIRNDQVNIYSEDIDLLGGKWTIDGIWPVRNGLFRIDNISVQHLSLPLATGDPEIHGTVDGKWSVDVYAMNLPGIVVEGSATAHDVSIHDNPNLIADQIDIPRMRLSNTWARTGPITLKYGGGSANVRAVTTLDDPKRIWVNATTSAWPLVLPYTQETAATQPSTKPSTVVSTVPTTQPDDKARALLTANADLDVDVAARTALGNMDLTLDTLWKSAKFATLKSAIDVNQRTFTFTDIKLTSHNSAVTGKAQVNLDDLLHSTADLALDDFDLATLAHDSAAFQHVTGRVTGSLHVGPATMQRPLGPLEINLKLKSENVKLKNLALGDFQATAFVAPDRIVLNDSPDRPTEVAVAGGFIHFWGRVTRHVDDIYQAQLQVVLENLDLDTVIPAGTKTAKTPGILSGQITVVMQPKHPELTFGQGSMRIDQSDLAGTGPIAFIYNILHIFHSANKPTGNGAIDFNIQGRDAIVTSMRYFDRGAEIRISGLVHDLPNLPHSGLNLVALASARPLKLLNIPGLSDIDQALSAIQRNALTVQITGYLDQPKEKEVLFQDVTNDLRNMLFGSFQSGDQGQ